MDAGTFREDLLFRLNVVNLRLPPLRERPGDIAALAEHFVRKYAAANGVPERPLSPSRARRLASHRWPGNVRELENAMHRAVLLATGDEIEAEAIRLPDGRRGRPAARSRPRRDGVAGLVGRTVAEVERELILETLATPSATAPTRRHPRHLDPHAAQQAARIRRGRASPVPAAGRSA